MSQTHKLHSLVEITEGKQSKLVSESAASLYTSALLERQAHWESNARTYPRRIPIAIRSAQGIYVKDVEGREYIDCLAGAGALALGHSHPVVVEAIQRALAGGVPFQTLDLTTPIKDRFIQDLSGSLPAEFADHAKIQFCGPSGADAIEAALKLVKTQRGGAQCYVSTVPITA